MVSNLSKSNLAKLPHTMELKKKYPLLADSDICAKGVFPYSYVNSWAKLQEGCLPTVDKFYDTLEDAVVTSEVDYQRAQRMFAGFGCRSLHDYQLR